MGFRMQEELDELLQEIHKGLKETPPGRQWEAISQAQVELQPCLGACKNMPGLCLKLHQHDTIVLSPV